MTPQEWDRNLSKRDPLPPAEADAALLEALEDMRCERYTTEWPHIGRDAWALCWPTVASNGILMIDDTDQIMTYPGPSTSGDVSAYLRIIKGDSDEYTMAFANNMINRSEQMFRAMNLDTSEPVRKMIAELHPDSSYRIDSVIAAMMYLARSNDRFKALLNRMNTDVDTVVADVFDRVFNSGGSKILRDRSIEYVQLMSMVADQAWPKWREGSGPKNFDRIGKLLDYANRVPNWSYGLMCPCTYTLVYPEPIYGAIRKMVESGFDPIMPHWALIYGYGHVFNSPYEDPCTGRLRCKCRSHESKVVAGMTNTYNLDAPGQTHIFPWDIDEDWIEAYVALTERVMAQPRTFDQRVNADLALQEIQKMPMFCVDADGDSHFFHVDASGTNAQFTACEAGDLVTVGS